LVAACAPIYINDSFKLNMIIREDWDAVRGFVKLCVFYKICKIIKIKIFNNYNNLKISGFYLK